MRKNHAASADNSDAESRVWRYGLLLPTEGYALLEAQLLAAHHYLNDLIALERSRREVVSGILSETDTSEQDAQLVQMEAAIAEARTRVRQVPKTERPAIREAIRAWRRGIRWVRAERKAIRRAYAAERREDLDEIQERHNTLARGARANCDCYWGTYLQVEQAMEQIRSGSDMPQFRRWTGEGRIAVQLQLGLGVPDLIAGMDRRLQLTLQPAPVLGRDGEPRPGAWRPRVRMRIGSAADRTPLWAEWPVILHRPLPANAAVMWAVAVRRLVCGREEWSLHLTLRCAQLPADPKVDVAATATVAVHLGWRQRPENALRQAWIADDRSRSEEMRADPSIAGTLRKVADLASIRDNRLNALRPALARWLAARIDLPPWLTAETTTLALWKSPARFVTLARHWRGQRWEGDAEGYTLLETWRARDRHLWLWQTHAHRKALRRRRDGYRVLAATLARQYGTLVVDDTDYAALARKPLPEAKVGAMPMASRHRVEVAAGELRAILIHAFRSRQRAVIIVPSAYETRTCHQCGAREDDWDTAANLTNWCECGATWDQDENAARVMLLRAHEQRDNAKNAGTPEKVKPRPRGRFQRRREAAARKREQSLRGGVVPAIRGGSPDLGPAQR